MNEREFLAKGLDNARNLSRFYLSKLKDIDPTKTYHLINGVELNSYYWIYGHMVWAQNLLVLKNLRNDKSNLYPWLDNFAVGSAPNIFKGPDFLEILAASKEIHKFSLETILTSRLEFDNNSDLNFDFGSGNSIREILFHAIRHESVHCGHLGWICKFNGISTL